MLTVGELRKMLEDVPDDVVVKTVPVGFAPQRAEENATAVTGVWVRVNGEANNSVILLHRAGTLF